VLIHAGRVPDRRRLGWELVPPELQQEARLMGGIVGTAELTECVTYTTAVAFVADRASHLNDPSWFRPPRLYGFHFARMAPLPFRACKGALFFFPISAKTPAAAAASKEDELALFGPEWRTQLLVSVRSPAEAAAALDGGADLIDVKEPRRGPLGRADEATLAAVVRLIAGRRPVSAALGELAQQPLLPPVPGLAYVKWGLAGWTTAQDWRLALPPSPGPPQVVVAAYADWREAACPPIAEVARFALEQPGSVLLIDTFSKAPQQRGGRTRSLLDWLPLDEVVALCSRCRAAGVRVALAGSLGPQEIGFVLAARPDWIGIRGAACDGGRDGAISTSRVRALTELIQAGASRCPAATGRTPESPCKQ
jgi:uncharacterized protein (UPF0264 family)